MNMNTPEANEIMLDGLREDIKLYESLSRLMDNEDFKYVILENFIKGKSIRLVEYLAHYTSKNQFEINDIVRSLQSVSFLKYYIDLVLDQGIKAKEQINEIINDNKDNEDGK